MSDTPSPTCSPGSNGSGTARAAEDYRDLGNLQGGYGHYVDKGLWDQAADLFAGGGTLEIAGRGIYVRRERVHEYLHHLPA